MKKMDSFQTFCMSSRHETFPFAVVMMLFYSYLDFVDFYAPVSWIICVSGTLFLVRHVTIVFRAE